MPDGSTNATSPSISALSAGNFLKAPARTGKRAVQSSPLRLNSVMSSPTFRAMMR